MARQFHTDDRTFSNFQPAELKKLCGVPEGRWPLYVVKELADNALAVMDEIPGSRIVKFVIDERPVGGFVEIGDSGPGISDDVLEQVLDFTKFGGSNRHHKLPTRGAQGNALMTVIGIAASWNMSVVIGRKDLPSVKIRVEIDQIRQNVDVIRTECSESPEGSFVRVYMPVLPCKRGGVEYQKIEEICKLMAWVNPHVTFMTKIANGRSRVHSVPAVSGATPSMPPHVTCGAASWFTVDDFMDRLAADIRARPSVGIREWAAEFMNVKRVPVSFGDGSISSVTPDELSELKKFSSAMRDRLVSFGSVCRDPKFSPLGLERMSDALESMGADPKSSPEYHSIGGVFGRGEAEIPFLMEVCLVQMPEKTKNAPPALLCMNRTVLYGSPTFDNLRWREKVRGPWHGLRGDLGSICRAYQIDSGKTPAAVMVHITCPSPGYSGYGKQNFDTDWACEPLSECMERVTLQVRRQRAGESRRRSSDAVKEESIKDTLFGVLPEALNIATDGGKLPPPMIRQLYYAVRGVWDSVHSSELQYQTFCVYVGLYEEEKVGGPVCYKDPRGTLIEPHSRRKLRLGTDEVNKFQPKKWEGHTIIFLEKEGFAHQLDAYGITKRFDAIVVGSKGFAVESCREVLQKYKKLLGGMVKIIALSDADPAGYMIRHDLATNLPRFGENVDVQVIGVGLKMSEALDMGLMDEPFDLRKSTWSMVQKMRRTMTPDGYGRRGPLLDPAAWDKFMPDMFRGASYPSWCDKPRGRRIELNAMRPRVFIDWLEMHLEAHGCKKVRPPDEIVDETLRDARENAIRREAGELFFRLMGNDVVFDVMREIGIPAHDLDAVLEMKPEQHWSYLVKRAGESGDIEGAVERVMRKRMPGAFK